MKKNHDRQTADRYVADYVLRRPYGTEFYAAIVIDTQKERSAYQGEAKWHDAEKAMQEAREEAERLNRDERTGRCSALEEGLCF